MKTLKLTAKDFTNNQYNGCDSIDCDGDIVIEGNLGILRFSGSLVAKGSITINAGSGINAGWGINAGRGINAGWGINAGEGINAGLQIICAGLLEFKFNLFAGLCTWKEPTSEDRKVMCGKINGNVAYGDVTETGLDEPDDTSCDGKIVEIDGKAYKLKLVKEPTS